VQVPAASSDSSQLEYHTDRYWEKTVKSASRAAFATCSPKFLAYMDDDAQRAALMDGIFTAVNLLWAEVGMIDCVTGGGAGSNKFCMLK
jgi:hypothetical protein